MNLFDGMAGKVALTDLVFENEHQTAGDDDGVGAAPHAGDGELEENMGLGQGGSDTLKIGNLSPPRGALCRFDIERQRVGKAAEDRHRVGRGKGRCRCIEISPPHSPCVPGAARSGNPVAAATASC
jgi:hypothetical protein